MRIAILGAGGIGAYYGARLQAAGHAVQFIARGAHLAALQTHGLVIEHPQFPFQARVAASPLEDFLADTAPQAVDFVIVGVKAMSTAAIAPMLARWIGSAPTLVASLQNGVDNEPTLARALGRDRVIGGLSRRLGAQVVAPGRIRAVGPAETRFGPWPRTAEAPATLREAAGRLVDTCQKAQLPTTLSEDIRYELWKKLVVNNGVNPLSALVRKDSRTIAHDPLLAPIVHAMMAEAARAAAADGVSMGEAEVTEMYELIRGFDPIKTSMLIDLEAGRPLELDAIPGAVVERAQRLGSAVPYTETCFAVLKHTT